MAISFEQPGPFDPQTMAAFGAMLQEEKDGVGRGGGNAFAGGGGRGYHQQQPDGWGISSAGRGGGGGGRDEQAGLQDTALRMEAALQLEQMKLTRDDEQYVRQAQHAMSQITQQHALGNIDDAMYKAQMETAQMAVLPYQQRHVITEEKRHNQEVEQNKRAAQDSVVPLYDPVTREYLGPHVMNRRTGEMTPLREQGAQGQNQQQQMITQEGRNYDTIYDKIAREVDALLMKPNDEGRRAFGTTNGKANDREQEIQHRLRQQGLAANRQDHIELRTARPITDTLPRSQMTPTQQDTLDGFETAARTAREMFPDRTLESFTRNLNRAKALFRQYGSTQRMPEEIRKEFLRVVKEANDVIRPRTTPASSDATTQPTPQSSPRRTPWQPPTDSPWQRPENMVF